MMWGTTPQRRSRWLELRIRGEGHSRKRIARLMRHAGRRHTRGKSVAVGLQANKSRFTAWRTGRA
jgi:hypothetical protein